jgi:hypothetical protein
MRLFPFVMVGKPFTTLVEKKRAAWSGVPRGYRYTFPQPDRWKIRLPRAAVRRRSVA